MHVRSESGTVLELAAKSRPTMAALLAQLVHAELHVSRGLLLASSGVGEHAGLEQHEDGSTTSATPASPPNSPRRPPTMRLLRDGLLRVLYSGTRKHDVYVALFSDGIVIGFSEAIGARFVLQRAMSMSAAVFDLPPLSDDWKHCFVLTNVERVCRRLLFFCDFEKPNVSLGSPLHHSLCN